MASKDPHRPNILFVLTDDQGAWALTAAGNDEIITPNLDRLAASGIRFENFFCASPVCSPARASILTGRIPSQHGVHDWIRKGNLNALSAQHGWDDDRAIEYLKEMRGYTDALAEAGYVCGISGKWHLGDSLTPQKGFTYWNIFPWGGGDYYNAFLIRDGKLEQDSRYLTDVITEGGLEFLDAQRQSDAAFYLSVHYTAPHSPWGRGQHPDDLVALYADCPFDTCPVVPGGHPWQINSAPRGAGAKRRELLSGYYAAITGVDRGMGQLLAKLDELGVRENTLVIFTSDNGMNMGHHGIWGKGNGTFPLNMYDTSVKAPMLMARPSHVPAGAVCRDLLSQYDLLPTLLDYTGLLDPGLAGPVRQAHRPYQASQPTQSNRPAGFDLDGLPGRSFAPLLRGQTLPGCEHVVVFDEYGPVRMIRTTGWKYIHRYPYGPHELYDLVNDPQEERNLAIVPEQQDRCAELEAELEAWFVRYADPRLDGAKEPVTGKGQIALAGVAGQGRKAFSDDWWYIDEHSQRRDDRRWFYNLG